MGGPKSQVSRTGGCWLGSLAHTLGIAVLLLVSACGSAASESPLATSSPHKSPLSPLDGGAAAVRTDSFLRRRVGSEYYDAHFVLVAAERFGAVLKASYLYTYRPYAVDVPMILFLDEDGTGLASEEASLVLLTPQEFNLDVQQAAAFAVECGLDETDECRVELYIGSETGYRFAWRFVGQPAGSVGAPPGNLLDVAIDVEDGQVYFCEFVGLGQGGQ